MSLPVNTKGITNDIGEMIVVKYNKTKPLEVIEVKSPKLHDTLTDVQIKYHAHLQKGVQKGKCVTWYDCHQVGVPRRVHAFTQR